MKNKYFVKIDDKGILRTLIYKGETYQDYMIQESAGSWKTTGESIESQLEELIEINDGHFISEELIEAISNNQVEGILAWLN